MIRCKQIWMVLVILILAIIFYVFIINNLTNMSFVDCAKIIINLDENNSAIEVSCDELSKLTAIFNHKLLYIDSPSCGFSENISISFNDGSQTFYVAQDTCPVIFWTQKNRYFKLSPDEYNILCEIFKNHGVTFPCI